MGDSSLPSRFYGYSSPGGKPKLVAVPKQRNTLHMTIGQHSLDLELDDNCMELLRTKIGKESPARGYELLWLLDGVLRNIVNPENKPEAAESLAFLYGNSLQPSIRRQE